MRPARQQPGERIQEPGRPGEQQEFPDPLDGVQHRAGHVLWTHQPRQPRRLRPGEEPGGDVVQADGRHPELVMTLLPQLLPERLRETQHCPLSGR